MTIDQLGSFGELISAFATLATLIYLALQIRQNTASTKMAASQSVLASLNNALQIASSSSETAKATVMGQTDFYELTYEEQAQFIVWIFSWFRTLEQAHFYYLQGYLDEEIWESQVKHLRQIIKTEGVKNWWDARRAFFNSTFQDLVDRAFEAALPGDDPRSVLKAIKKGTA